jgi:hypothetical protein
VGMTMEHRTEKNACLKYRRLDSSVLSRLWFLEDLHISKLIF